MNKVIFYSEAISALRPTSGFVIEGTDYSTLSWKDTTTTPPTQSEVEAKALELEEEYNSKDYARNRVLEYPSIGDQLDALFHAGVFPEAMAAQIQAIKDKYPKV